MYSRTPEVQRSLARTTPQCWETLSEKTPGYCYLVLFRQNERPAIARMAGPYPRWGDLKKIGNFLRRTYSVHRRDGVIHLSTEGIGRYPSGLTLRDDEVLGSVDKRVILRNDTIAPLLGFIIFVSIVIFALLICKVQYCYEIMSETITSDYCGIVPLFLLLLIVNYRKIEIRRINAMLICIICCSLPSVHANDIDMEDHSQAIKENTLENNNFPKIKEIVTDSKDKRMELNKIDDQDMKYINIDEYDLNIPVNCSGDFSKTIDKLKSHVVIGAKSECIVNFVYKTHLECYNKNFDTCCSNRTAIVIITHFSDKVWYNDYIDYMCEDENTDSEDNEEDVDPKTTGEWIDNIIKSTRENVNKGRTHGTEAGNSVNAVLNRMWNTAADSLPGQEILNVVDDIKNSDKYKEFKDELGKIMDEQSTSMIHKPRKVIEEVGDVLAVLTPETTGVAEDLVNIVHEMRNGAINTYDLGKRVLKSAENIVVDTVDVVETHFTKQKIEEKDGETVLGKEPKGIFGVYKHFLGDLLSTENAKETSEFIGELVAKPLFKLINGVTILETNNIYHQLNALTAGLGITTKSDLETGQEKFGTSVTQDILAHKRWDWITGAIALIIVIAVGTGVVRALTK